MSVNHSARSGGITDFFFSIFFMTVYCVLSLESPHRGDSTEYTQYTIFNIKKTTTLKYYKSAVIGFFPRDSRTSSNSRDKQAISAQTTEGLLYVIVNIVNPSLK